MFICKSVCSSLDFRVTESRRCPFQRISVVNFNAEPLVRHSDFRLFACMNPATDVGKRNLPLGIRNRFTELYVEELESEGDLRVLVSDYLKGLNLNRSTIHGIIRFGRALNQTARTTL